MEYIFVLFLILALIFIKLMERRNGTTKAGAPFVPMEPEVVENIMRLLEIKKGEIFYDLGSGDGRMVIAAALRGAEAYGIEVDKYRVWYSRFLIFILGLRGKAKIIQGDVFETDISRADLVTVYLLQETNDILINKFEKELKPEVRIVSAAFVFPTLKLIKTDLNGPIYGPLHLYKFGEIEVSRK